MRIVYSYYVADLMHKGHMLQMKNAKEMAGKDGISVVGILTKEAVLEKKPKKPILNFDDRVGLAEAIKYNDIVIPQTTYSPIPNLKMIRPDICMESESHKEEDIEKVREYMKSIGGRVVVTPYYPYISSTSIKKKIRSK